MTQNLDLCQPQVNTMENVDRDLQTDKQNTHYNL